MSRSPSRAAENQRLLPKYLNLFYFCCSGSKIHIWRLLSPFPVQLFHFAVLPPPSTQWAFASVPGALQNTCSMQNTPLKLNSFCFRCQEFKRHDWRHLAHFSCSSATAGMHVARIQNCPEAHPEQLRIKDCFQNTKFILFLLFRVQDSHLEASESLPVQLFHFAVLPPPSTQWALASVPGALQNTCSMQNTPLKLNSFCFWCQVFKRHDWRHLAHFSCSSATAGMHVARIQNCPGAHPEQLRIKDCFQNT